MPHFNPIDRLQNTQWELYKPAAFKAQIASGLVLLISAVALAIIMSLNPQVAYFAANAHPLIVIGSVGGASLLVFALASGMHFQGVVENGSLMKTHKKLPLYQMRAL